MAEAEWVGQSMYRCADRFVRSVVRGRSSSSDAAAACAWWDEGAWWSRHGGGGGLQMLQQQQQQQWASMLLLLASIVVVAVRWSRRRRSRQVYLVDYACFVPPARWRVSYATFLEHSALSKMSASNLEFQRKIIGHSGLSQLTALPPSYHSIPCDKGMEHSRRESQTVFFAMLDELFAKTGVKPADVAILVLNCCLFYPSPSLSAMLVNRYKMRAGIKSFNVAGMGCAASLLAVDMAKQLLAVRPGSYALVVSSENMSGRDYMGARKSMLIANCLFRTGGAAVLLSNRAADGRRAKYRLLHTERTNAAADARAFSCITHGEDDEGNVGVSLSKELMAVAAGALTRNMTAMAPRVLPWSELLKYAARTLLASRSSSAKPSYVPDFKRAFSHFCIHAGGKAVIHEMERSLRLPESLTEPSRMTLHRFGNTSSTSVWYEMAYLEAMRRVKRRHRLWQVALGSGFKCFSAVWEAQWDSRCTHHNPWRSCLLTYPLHVPDCCPELADDDDDDDDDDDAELPPAAANHSKPK